MRQFYALLPADTVAAHQRFAASTRPALATFQAQWADVEVVKIQGKPKVSGDSAHLTLRIKKTAGKATVAPVTVTVVVSGSSVQIGTISAGGPGGTA